MIRTNKIILTISSISIFILLFTFSLYFLKDSYAITVDDSGVPTNTFNSNFSGTETINYVQKALGNSYEKRKYIGNFNVPLNYRTNDNSTPLYVLTKNSKFARTTEQFQIIPGDNPMSVTDNGIKYILSHGYNNLNINNIFSKGTHGTVDNNIQQYLTQITLWLYLYENKTQFTADYCKNINVHLSTEDNTPEAFKEMNGCDFYNSYKDTSYVVETTTAEEMKNIIKDAAGKNGYEYFNYVLELLEGATKATTSTQTVGLSLSSSESSNYTITPDGKILYTEVISPSATNPESPILSYSVNIDDPNNYGAYIADPTGNKIDANNVNSGGFKVYIPLKDDMDLTSVKITVTANFLKLDANSYRVTNSTSEDSTFNSESKQQQFSDVLLGYIPTQQVSKNLNLKNLVKISKIDATNKKELPGASLVIKNKTTNEEVASWTSTTTPKYIYLESGDYTLCESTAPDNYSLNEECIDFKVDGTTTPTITMKNSPLSNVGVPNTNAFLNSLPFISGGLALLIGCGVIGITIYKKRKE